MKFKTTIILIIIAVVGAAYVFLYEKKQDSAEEKYRYQKKVFFGLSADSVFKIKVKKNSETFLFVKKDADSYGRGGDWVLEEPIKTRADKAIIAGFLSELEFLKKTSKFKEEEKKGRSKKEYGLDKPTFEITFWTKQSLEKATQDSESMQTSDATQEHSFNIGARVSTGTHVYLQLKKSDEVIVVEDTIALKLDFNLNGFKDKFVMNIDPESVSRLKISRPDKDNMELSKDVDQWRMEKPVVDRCDNKKIAELITKLQELKIEAEEDFVTDSDSTISKYGLDNPKYHVEIEQNGMTQGVIFGHLIDNKVYTRRDGEKSVFLLKDLILNSLSTGDDILRSRELIRFETAAGTLGVDKVEIETPETKIVIEKTNKYDWKITEPVETLADMDVVKELIEEVKDLRILRFITNKSDDLKKYGLGGPLYKLIVHKGKNTKPTVVLFGKATKDNQQCYAKRHDEDPVFAVTTKGIYEKLTGGLIAIQDKLVIEFDKNNVNEIVVEKNSNTFIIKKNDSNKSNWILTKPVNDLPDDNLVDQIVQSISFLKAEKYFAKDKNNLNEYGLINPAIMITVSYDKVEGYHDTDINESPTDNNSNKGSTESATLLIGNHISHSPDSNYYGMVKGNEYVFEIDSEVVSLFNTEIVSKTVQKFNSTKAKRLVLSTKDKEAIFGRPEGTWKAIEPTPDNVHSRQIEFVIWLLSDFTAAEIVEYNLNNVMSYGLDSPDIKASVQLFDDTIFEILAVKKSDNQGYFVMSRNSNCIYTVSDDVMKKLIEQELLEIK